MEVAILNLKQHIMIKGKFQNGSDNKFSQELYFENKFDQTCL